MQNTYEVTRYLDVVHFLLFNVKMETTFFILYFHFKRRKIYKVKIVTNSKCHSPSPESYKIKKQMCSQCNVSETYAQKRAQV
jgi:hypothetical protein